MTAAGGRMDIATIAGLSISLKLPLAQLDSADFIEVLCTSSQT